MILHPSSGVAGLAYAAITDGTDPNASGSNIKAILIGAIIAGSASVLAAVAPKLLDFIHKKTPNTEQIPPTNVVESLRTEMQHSMDLESRMASIKAEIKKSQEREREYRDEVIKLRERVRERDRQILGLQAEVNELRGKK